MILNCQELKLWTKEVVENMSGAYLHRFKDIPDEKIGDIPKTWNTLDWMDETTKLIHYNQRRALVRTVAGSSLWSHLVAVS